VKRRVGKGVEFIRGRQLEERGGGVGNSGEVVWEIVWRWCRD
jgi:hypothetical protein